MPVYEYDKVLDKLDAREVTYQKDDVLFQKDSLVKKVYFVTSGEVRTESYLENGSSVVYFRVRKGEILSEESLFLSKHLYTAIATQDRTAVRVISKPLLKEKIENDSSVRGCLMSCLAGRYEDSLMNRELLSIRSAEERLYVWLNWYAQKGLSLGKLTGRIGSIAPDLGLTPESVYRALTKLEEANRIVRIDGEIHFPVEKS